MEQNGNFAESVPLVPYSHWYFFCLQPPVPIRRQMGVLRDQFGHGDRPVADHRLHMTLARTARHERFRPDVAAELTAIGERIDAEPFRISLDRLSAGHWGVALRPNVTPQGLRLLQRQIHRCLAVSSVAREDHAFNPHVTLSYGPREPYLRSVPPFAWRAAHLVLIHSIVGAGKHVELGRWRLERRQLSLAF